MSDSVKLDIKLLAPTPMQAAVRLLRIRMQVLDDEIGKLDTMMKELKIGVGEMSRWDQNKWQMMHGRKAAFEAAIDTIERLEAEYEEK